MYSCLLTYACTAASICFETELCAPAEIASSNAHPRSFLISLTVSESRRDAKPNELQEATAKRSPADWDSGSRHHRFLRRTSDSILPAGSLIPSEHRR